VWESLSYPWQVCVEQAWKGYCAGSFPIGAAVVGPDGQVLSVGAGHLLDSGQILLFRNPGDKKPLDEHELAHAEVQALLSMDYEAVDPRTCALYTTMEPCPLCIGAATMLDVREVRYACRDPWAGCAHLVETDPYIRSQIHRVVGPESAELETALGGIKVDFLIRRMGRDGLSVHDNALPDTMPRAVELGRMLFESDRLPEMRERGASAAEMLDQLAALAGDCCTN
jgi:tRNA(adenine34) deaminase